MTWLRLRHPKAWGNLLLIVVGVTFLTLSFPPFHFPYLAWVALVPLLLLIKRLSLLRAALGALALSFFFYSALGWWMLYIDGVHPGNLGVQVLVNALYVGLFGLFAQGFNAKMPRWNVLTFPSIWVLIEYLKSHVGFLSCPWGILGYSQYTVLTVAQLSAWAGVYGVSFLILAVNTMAAELSYLLLSVPRLKDFRVLLSRRQRAFSWQLLILAVIFLTAAFPHKLSGSGQEGARPELTVALVQANVYSRKTAHIRSSKAVFQNFSRLSLSAAKSRPHLIVWPSCSVTARFPYDRGSVKDLSHLAKETNSFLLFGSGGYDKLTARSGEKRFANSAFLLSPEGGIMGRYDKILLLPFDEYLPLRNYVKWPSWIVSYKPDALPGTKLTILNTDRANFGVQICWENLFPDLFRKLAARGVDFMVSMTNESFIHVPAAHYQMLAMNVFRAIENHVAILRTAPTGVSAIIAPNGRITTRVQDTSGRDVNVEGVLVGEIPLVSERSFYNRHGDWFVFFLAIISVGFLAAALYEHRKPNGAQLVP